MGQRIVRSAIKGERKHNQLTFNPTSVNMGEKLYITIPALDSSLSIIPKTTNLIYNLKISNDKSWPLNNMNRLFVQGLQVKLGRDIVYDNVGESVYRLYEDLWKSSEERSGLTGYGITSLETRKNLSGTSGASTSSTTDGSLDTLLATVCKNQRIQLGQILDDHGLDSPGAHNFDTKYVITLPSRSENIGDKLSSQTVGNFSLENLQLEYDTVRNSEIVESNKDDVSGGKNFILHHVSLEAETEWDKDATLVNENLHINRESMKALVFLFKWVDQNMDEVYMYPNITEVTCNVNGKPNMIHSDPMKPDIFEREAKRFFRKEKSEEMSTGKFFKDSFALVVDFRTLGEKDKYNDGIKVSGSSGIQVTFKRNVTAKNVKCYSFVVSDSIVQMDNNGYQKTII